MPPAPQALPPALVVFGGTGFVGTAVLAEALRQNAELQVFALSRNGVAPAWLSAEPVYQTRRLRFVSGDLLAPQTVRDALREVAGACERRNVHLVEGSDLFQSLDGYTEDLTHPGDAAMTEIADRLAPVLDSLLEGAGESDTKRADT